MPPISLFFIEVRIPAIIIKKHKNSKFFFNDNSKKFGKPSPKIKANRKASVMIPIIFSTKTEILIKLMLNLFFLLAILF